MKHREQIVELRKLVIDIYEHEPTGWMVAKSDDVPNFYAHGESVEAIRKKLPRLLKAFFHAKHYSVGGVRTHIDKTIPEGFFPMKVYVDVQIEDPIAA